MLKLRHLRNIYMYSLIQCRLFWEITRIVYIAYTCCDQHSRLQGARHSNFLSEKEERKKILICALRIIFWLYDTLFSFETPLLDIKRTVRYISCNLTKIGILRFIVYCVLCFETSYSWRPLFWKFLHLVVIVAWTAISTPCVLVNFEGIGSFA